MLRVPKNLPRMPSGTSSDMEADHATPQTALARVETKEMQRKTQSRCGPRPGKATMKVQGNALAMNITTMICRRENQRCSNNMTGGCRKRQRKGIAASTPTPASLQPSVLTANPMTNGKLPSVRLSIGTLKQLSIVQYLSESSSSRLRSGFMDPPARREWDDGSKR